ncbi:MAG: transglutaminase family protein, partial [Pseudomonadota bacterium]
DIEGENDLARMHALNAAVHALVDYKPGVTDMTTTAEETATRHVGVCQDFTHLFIAAARQMGLPARYVVGYLYNETSSEPASHAWAETFIDGLGWIGFDPVHEVCPAEHHIRMMSGFDAPDAAPIRGTMLPGSSEEMEIAVEIGPTGQSQSQSQSS